MYSNWKKVEDKNNKQIIKIFVKVLSLNQGKKVEVGDSSIQQKI